MARILHITNYYYPHVGGIETATRDIVNVLRKDESNAQMVVCFGDGPNIIDDIPIVRFRYFVKLRSQAISLKYKRKLKRTLYIFQPDIVIFHTPNPLIEYYYLSCKYEKCKLVVYHHLDIYKQKILKNFVKPVEYGLKEKADIILASSQNYIDGSKELKKYKNKCRIIPLCYKEEDFVLSESEKIEVNKIRERYKDKTILFFSGRHTKFKGLHLALEAVAKLPNVVFIVGRIGDANTYFERLIEKAKNVVYLGKVDRRQYITYLTACDFYLFPSLSKNEAFPITLLEVIALGKCPITFTIPGSGVNYISLNNVTGLECHNGNVKEFTEAIIKLINDKELRAKLSENGKKRAKELFNYQKFDEAFTNLINEIKTK